jgi:alkaline phosphatase D
MHPIVLPLLASFPFALASIPADAMPQEERRIPIDEVQSRRWIGAAWQPSRLQDWRLEDGRLVNDDSRLPVRTAHVLPLRIEPDGPESSLAISVDVRAVGGGPLDAGSFAGLLFGAGGPDVDPRLTALVQQVPAPDGGMLAVVAGTATGRLLDFSTQKQGGFSWALPAKTTLEDLEAVPQERIELRQTGVEFRRFTLDLLITPRDGRFDVDLSARDGDAIFTVVSARGLERDRIDGGIALVGHRSARKDGIGWSFADLRLRGAELDAWLDETDHSWGPVLGVTYTLDRNDDGIHALRLNTLFPPVAASDLGDVALEFETRDGIWRPIATGRIVDDSFTVTFDVDDVEEYLGREYRVRGALNDAPFEWRGEIHAPPVDRPLRIASLNCVKNVTAHSAWNRQGVWFPHDELVAGVAAQDPDFLFFAGDQIYEGDLNGVDRRKIMLDYHTKYQRWLRSFAELCRDRPCVIIPDDHDVYHGNIWGAGGVLAKAKDGLTVQDSGGYKLRADVVNAIHRTQVGNLPPCVVPGPIGQGIQPYTTRVRFGPADFAVVADRMWKDSASVELPEAKVRNGWFRNPDFDPKDADVPDAMFLGPTQEAFLEDWAASRDPRSPRKIVLSQTPWVNVATLPPGRDDGVVPGLKIHAAGEYAEDDVPAADTDSGGWPQSARTRAVRSLQVADALHLCGDQHLGSLVQYGVDAHRDGTFAFTPPAVANTWPRRWMPIDEGANRWEGAPRYAGDFEDGFGNLMTVFAVTNPEDRGIAPRRLYDLSPGYGMVEVDPVGGGLVLEAWPRWSEPDEDDAAQYPGFPFRISGRE